MGFLRPEPVDALSTIRQVSVSVNLLQQFSESSQLSGGNAASVEELYETYLRDANAVAPEWRKDSATFLGRS